MNLRHDVMLAALLAVLIPGAAGAGQGQENQYTGKATIKATVQRAKGDTGPLTVSIKVHAISASKSLLPATIKAKVK